MKRLVLLLTLITALCGRMTAGENDTYFGFNAGVLYPRIFNITAQYEIETKYHNAWEIYLDYATQWNKCRTCGKVCMDSFWKEEYAYGLGVAYKPAFSRGKNSFGRFRFGADLGASTRNFALGVEVGLEWVWTLRNRMQIVFQQKNEVTFWAKPRFKNGALIGIRMPL